MSVNEGYQAADGAVRLEDQSQIVNSLERLTLDDQTHGNQAAVTQRLGQIAVNEDDSQRRNIFSSLDELDVQASGSIKNKQRKSAVKKANRKGCSIQVVNLGREKEKADKEDLQTVW